MIRMVKYMKSYMALAIAAPLFMFIEVMMDLMQPMFMKEIIDEGIVSGELSYVMVLLGKMLGVALIGYIGGVGCSYFSAKSAVYAGTDIRKDLFGKVQSLSYGNIDRLETGHLITRLTNDVTQVQRVLMMMQRIMVRAPLQIIGSFIMTYLISPKLFLILLIIVPLLILSMTIIIKLGYPLYRIVQKRLDGVNTVMQENLAGIRVVKAFVRSNFEKKRFSNVNDDYMYTTRKVSRVTAIMSPITMILVNIGIVAVLWFGGIEVRVGSLTVGEVLAFINYLLQLLQSLTMVANLLMMYSRGQASAERIIEVLDAESDVSDSEKAKVIETLAGDLVFDKVSFSYGDHSIEPVLTDISFRAKKGQKVAIIGSTGSGKSTLVNLIPRLYDVSSGTISIGNTDIREIESHSLRSRVGMVLQESILFSGTIKENIKYGKENATDEEAIEASIIACADDFVRDKEKGYESIVGQKGVNLSGGQKQRLAIARALVRQPEILILDDSTSAVDVVTESVIQEQVDNKLKDTIVVMVAQRISSVLDADQILVLDGGQLVGKGTHKELIHNNKVYRDIYVSQLGEVGEEYDA